jgi:hypothetical protein
MKVPVGQLQKWPEFSVYLHPCILIVVETCSTGKVGHFLKDYDDCWFSVPVLRQALLFFWGKFGIGILHFAGDSLSQLPVTGCHYTDSFLFLILNFSMSGIEPGTFWAWTIIWHPMWCSAIILAWSIFLFTRPKNLRWEVCYRTLVWQPGILIPDTIFPHQSTVQEHFRFC